MGKRGEELGDSGPEGRRWGPEQLLLLKFSSSAPEAARLARTEQSGRNRVGSADSAGGVRGRGGEGTWTRGSGPLGKQYPEGEIWKGRGRGGWLEPKDTPVRYQGQGERLLPW